MGSPRDRDIALGIDWRQRRAAALLLTAFDLPSEAGAACEQMLEAAEAAPGIRMDQLPMIEQDNRLSHLEDARDLIIAMIEEIDQ